MASTLVLQIHTELSQTEVKNRLQHLTNGPREALVNTQVLLKGIANRQRRSKIYVSTSAAAPVAATGTFTLVSVVATDACTIGTTTFTFTSTPSLNTDVEVDGADDAADALALATVINAHPVVGQIVRASAASNVVTLTAVVRGVVGNFIPISDADTTITTSGSFLTGGAGGSTEASTTLSLGL